MKNKNGFTLIEIICVLLIIGTLATTAAAKYVDVEANAKRTILENAVTQLNSHVLMAWVKCIFETGQPGYNYYEGFISEDNIITKQKPGQESKKGHIYFKSSGTKYKLNWDSGDETNYGRFSLGGIAD